MKAQDRLPAILVARPIEVEVAQGLQANGHVLVAGTLHVRNLLADAEIDCVPAAQLIDASGKADVLAEVALLADRLRAADWERVPVELAAILQSVLVRWAFRASACHRVEASLGMPLEAFDDAASLHPAANPQTSRLAELVTRPGRPRTERGPVGDGLRPRQRTLDFRSRSGSKLDAGEARPHIVPVASRKSDMHIGLRNLAAVLGRGRPTKFRYGVPALLPEGQGFALPDLVEMVAIRNTSWERPAATALIDDTAVAFRTYRSAMRAALRRTGSVERALFNHVGDPERAGYVAALREAGIACEMSSHGCLARTGEEPRDRVAATLGPVIYNSFPGMGRIVPRSPLQAVDAWPGQEIGKVVRVVRSAEERRPGPFRILHAPNFLPWATCYHGLAIDCFQTYDAVAALARAVATSPGIELDVRIKVSSVDTPGSLKKVVRGLMPKDVTDLMNPSLGVRDASSGSHGEAMKRADLIVTEGLTAVMFEALELRKPVLLLGAEELPPALPHSRAASLLEGAARAPVYACAPNDDLRAILREIAELHTGADLTDDEIAPYVWTDSHI